MKKIFAIADIHGEHEKLKLLLSDWNPKTEQLVLLGDLSDRGAKSLEVFREAMRLEKEHQAIVLRGNHDQIFLDWLEEPELHAEYYFKCGGFATIHSFFGYPITDSVGMKEIAERIKREFSDIIKFLHNRPYFFEWGKFLFVHAGIAPYYNDWTRTDFKQFLWIRSEFHHSQNDSGKIVVFGHTVTSNIHPATNNEIWISHCQTKIGLDGGAVYGGNLHGLHIDANNFILLNTTIRPDNSIERQSYTIVPQNLRTESEVNT